MTGSVDGHTHTTEVMRAQESPAAAENEEGEGERKGSRREGSGRN